MFRNDNFDFEAIHYSDHGWWFNMLCCIVSLSVSDYKLLRHHNVILEDGTVTEKPWETYTSKGGVEKKRMFDFFYTKKSQAQTLLAWMHGNEPAPKSLKGCLEEINKHSSTADLNYDAIMESLLKV